LRRYTLNQRAVRAADTRQRIVDAARFLFLKEGFDEVSLDAIAARAKVGRTTIFEQFGDKRTLFREAIIQLSVEGGVDQLLADLKTADPRRALRVAFELGCRVWAAEAMLLRKLTTLAMHDATLREVMAEKAAGRLAQVEQLVDKLHAAKLLAVPRQTASEGLDLLTSFAAFDTLYQRTQSIEQTAAQLLRLAGALLVW
jgi:TetR/AcrR family transcriptional repressor of mexJK operon